jgi:2,3-bisphosphoglycerate-independent phosphoglycerate mutase
MHHVVLVFVDGLGLGDREDPSNPCVHPELHLLANFRSSSWTPPPDGGRPETLPEIVRERPLPFAGRAVVTDASLGVTGLPQSATGQTTIFTGINAALILGRHMYAYPTATLQRILLEHSILKTVEEAGSPALFANAFRPLFFELGEAVWKKSMSASSWANRAAGLPFRNLEDLLAGRAVYQDITHDDVRSRGFDLPHREPEEAGAILASLASANAFTLFEFFQTDKAGHAQDRAKAERELTKLERFLGALLESLNLDTTTLVVTSDHGNVEDLSTKSHTHNPVPTLVFGQDAEPLAGRLDRLERFTPAFLESLGIDSAMPNRKNLQ